MSSGFLIYASCQFGDERLKLSSWARSRVPTPAARIQNPSALLVAVSPKRCGREAGTGLGTEIAKRGRSLDR
jgi:hypothetical protein